MTQEQINELRNLAQAVIDVDSSGDAIEAATEFMKAAGPQEFLALIQQRDELLRIASDAATSLETIHIRSFGDDSYLNHPDQMRAYAGSRAGVVRKEIKDAEIDQ